MLGTTFLIMVHTLQCKLCPCDTQEMGHSDFIESISCKNLNSPQSWPLLVFSSYTYIVHVVFTKCPRIIDMITYFEVIRCY